MNFPSSSFFKIRISDRFKYFNKNILENIYDGSILAERAAQPELDSDRPKYCFFLTLFSRFDHNDARKKLTAKPQNGKKLAKQNFQPRKF